MPPATGPPDSPTAPSRIKYQLRPKYMTVSEWVYYSSIPRATTYEMIDAGKIKSILVGRRRLIDVDLSLAYLDSLAAA